MGEAAWRSGVMQRVFEDSLRALHAQLGEPLHGGLTGQAPEFVEA